ncbi:MAG: flagellin [Campylobacterota bacterium]|nr:flagellin [Campylobacterota bacterium]
MQIGHLNDVDQAQMNHVTQIQKVQEVDNDQKVNPDEQYKNAKPNDIIEDTNEVMLDNVQFGYNKKSQDFFIKITRGETENKYPTDYMMKLKASFIDAYEDQIQANS